MSESYFDAFISYAHKDRSDWVPTLAENLHQRGFEIFLDAWEIGAGDVLIHKLDRGILESRHGVLVLTESYFERPMVRAEYAAILQRTIDGKQRVVPVLVDDVEVPPLLASRIWIDFRGADGPAYEAKREELVRALQGKKTKDRPARIGETSPPPGSRYRPEGALRRTLRLGRESVALLKEGEEEAAHTPPALDSKLEGKLYELGRVRKRGFAASGTVLRKGSAATETAEASLHQASLAAGAELTRTFLDGAAGAALAEAVRLAASSGSSLELALEVADPDLRGLPWETLRLPAADNGGTSGEPLALHPRVQLYRAAPKDDPTPAHAIPGPLRILVAIGSPGTGGGELLDYERELARVLDAVEPARREGKPYVKILHRGTVEAIREALKAERFHVLHLSCHAGPGVLILENEEGDEDKVSATRFWKEAVPENRGVPLLVLAGCSTALDVRRKKSDEDEDEGEEVLPGLATELLDHGVAAVLAMQASVSDPYAADLAGRANHPLRETGVALRRADAEWSDRLELLQDHVLPQLPLVLFLDNFEDNLTEPEGAEAREVHNPALGEFLTLWLARPGESHILITCRYPFELPRKGHRYLEEHHLGPLSYAETRKLLWRLPALEALSPENRLRAYQTLGGHPRTLEYLDALLRGGSSNFTDVEIRLEGALEQGGIENPGAWIRDRVGKDLDKALAETVTLASADVLLKDLLKLLDATTLARRLLLGASVYRRPVDQTALDWQIGEEREPEPDSNGEELLKRVHERAQEVPEHGKEPNRDNLGLTEAEWQAYDEALRRHLAAPIEIPEEMIAAQNALERLGLLSRWPVGEASLFQVHRWTASALAEEAEAEILHDAHRRAARFWRWRVENMPQSRQADIDQLLEARHHHHAAGDLEEAVRVTEWICSQLDTWGEYSRVEQLCREILEWVPERSDETASFLSQLGTIALKRGFLDDALRWYRDSLDIFQDLGNREGVAGIYHEFGIVAQHKGHYDHALRWYQKSLDISQELENRANMAQSYGQLGIVTQLKGDYDNALDWNRKASRCLKSWDTAPAWPPPSARSECC